MLLAALKFAQDNPTYTAIVVAMTHRHISNLEAHLVDINGEHRPSPRNLVYITVQDSAIDWFKIKYKGIPNSKLFIDHFVVEEGLSRLFYHVRQWGMIDV